MKGRFHVAFRMRVSSAQIDIVTATLPIKRTHGEQKRMVVRIFADGKRIAFYSRIELNTILARDFSERRNQRVSRYLRRQGPAVDHSTSNEDDGIILQRSHKKGTGLCADSCDLLMSGRNPIWFR